MMMKRFATSLSIFTVALLGLAGCSSQSVPTNSSSNQTSTQNTAGNTASTANSQAQAGSSNGSSVDSTSDSTNLAPNNTTSATTSAPPSPIAFTADIQSVINGIQAKSAKMSDTIHATVTGNPYGKGIQAVRFVNASTGFLAGNGIILRTTDGGRVFQTSLQSSVDFTGLSAAKGQLSTIAAWGDHSIVVSQDGGKWWKTSALPKTSGTVQEVNLATQSEGFAILGDGYKTGTLWRTTDGGEDWTKVSTPSQVLSVSFGSDSVGWIGTQDGNIFETKNSGATWTRVFHPSAKYPGRPVVQAVSAQACWAMVIGGSGMSQTSYAVFRTADGSTWKPVLGVGTAGAGPAPDNASNAPKGPGLAPGPMVALNANQAAVAGVCRACGMGSAEVSATGNGGSSWTTHPTIQNGMGEPTSMSFISLNNGWMLDTTYTSGTVLLHTTDGGDTWKEVYPMVHPHPVEGISFLSAKIGYGLGIPGNANAVVKSTDGGHTWRAIGTLPAKGMKNPPVMVGHSPIDFVTDNRGYAVGADGNVYETTDGGQTWAASKVPQGKNSYISIHFADNGKYGVAWTYNSKAEVSGDGGNTWRTVSLPPNSTSEANADLYLAGLTKLPAAGGLKNWLHQQSPPWIGLKGTALAWLPGQSLQGLFITADGGAHWTNIYFGSNSPNPSDVEFVNSQDGWMIGMSGALLRTTDGGRVWTHAAHDHG